MAAFPIAPLFALLNNWVEIRLDARKLICETRFGEFPSILLVHCPSISRRPIAFRSSTIGIWFNILQVLAYLAIVANVNDTRASANKRSSFQAFLIAFTSEFLPKILYQYTINWDLIGYVNFTLAQAPAGTTSLPCKYTPVSFSKLLIIVDV